MWYLMAGMSFMIALLLFVHGCNTKGNGIVIYDDGDGYF